MKKEFLAIIMMAMLFACKSDEPVPVLQSIQISEKEITLKTGENHQFSVGFIPQDLTENLKFAWKTSDATIGKIDSNGLFNAISDGTVTVTVSATTIIDGIEKEFTSTSKVIIDPIPIESISLSPSSLSMKRKTNNRINVVYSPSNAKPEKITWSTSDQSVASVNDGVITANKLGIAVITGLIAGTEFKASCEISVTGSPIDAFMFYPQNIYIEEGEIQKVNVMISPEDAYGQEDLVYKSSNDNILKVNKNGEVEGIKKGTASMIVSTSDGLYSDACNATIVHFSERVHVVAGSGVYINGYHIGEVTSSLKNESSKDVHVTKLVVSDSRGIPLLGYSFNLNLNVKAGTKAILVSGLFLNNIYNPRFICSYMVDGVEYTTDI